VSVSFAIHAAAARRRRWWSRGLPIVVIAAVVHAHIVAPAEAQSRKPTPAPLAAADAAMAAARYADAARDYEAWLRDHPTAREVLFALGACYIQLGQTANAVQTLREYLRLAPDAAAGHALLGIALLDGVQTTEAKAELTRALALDPAQLNASEALARLALVEGDAASAVAILKPVATDVRLSDETRALYAEALIRSGDPRAAATLLEAAIDARPKASARTYALAVLARIKAGELEDAAGLAERGMRLYPDSEIEGVYLSLPSPLLASRTAARLERLQREADVAESIALGRVLTDVDPARKTRAHELALKLLQEAVTLAPTSASAHYNYGRALRQNDVQGALAEWHKALNLEPDDGLRVQILTQIAKSKDALSDAPGAEQAFRAALDLNRRLSERVPEAALEYVRFLQVHSRAVDAERVLDEIVGWNPWSPEVRIERARVLAAIGRWDAVIPEGEFVLRNTAENEKLQRVAHLLLASAYTRLKRPDEARIHQEWIQAH
jgi:tetratricopeptide (TPR) repeat protein